MTTRLKEFESQVALQLSDMQTQMTLASRAEPSLRPVDAEILERVGSALVKFEEQMSRQLNGVAGVFDKKVSKRLGSLEAQVVAQLTRMR